MYLMRSVENNFAGVSQMTDDCLNVTGIVSSGPHMEAQALMRDMSGVLHYVGSHETGWGAYSFTCCMALGSERVKIGGGEHAVADDGAHGQTELVQGLTRRIASLAQLPSRPTHQPCPLVLSQPNFIHLCYHSHFLHPFLSTQAPMKLSS